MSLDVSDKSILQTCMGKGSCLFICIIYKLRKFSQIGGYSIWNTESCKSAGMLHYEVCGKLFNIARKTLEYKKLSVATLLKSPIYLCKIKIIKPKLLEEIVQFLNFSTERQYEKRKER